MLLIMEAINTLLLIIKNLSLYILIAFIVDRSTKMNIYVTADLELKEIDMKN